MGFTTGMLGGITLTTTLLYLSLNLHARNRLHQSTLLHQQSLVLDRVVSPRATVPQPVSREDRAGLLESAKDRWNAELEANVRKVQGADWGALRERLEEGVAGVFGRGLEKGREEVGK
ncbi:hypothetical protein MBLNU230_g1637t1 [Neophaeotheca triangularis]